MKYYQKCSLQLYYYSTKVHFDVSNTIVFKLCGPFLEVYWVKAVKFVTDCRYQKGKKNIFNTCLYKNSVKRGEKQINYASIVPKVK